MTRYLVVCDNGQCRSVAMVTLLHEKGHEAIPISVKIYDSKGFENNGLNWCDWVLRMDEDASNPNNFRYSFEKNAWIGRDEWGNPRHPELIEKCKKKLEELGI